MKIKIFLSFLFSILLINQITAQESKLTVDWLFGNEAREINRAPLVTWLGYGTGVIYDTRAEPSERSFERFNPVDGKSEKLFDMTEAAESFSELTGESIPMHWPPNEYNINGSKALYVFKGDIFILDCASSKFEQITSTKEEEINVKFSPDGNKLAFVRKNNLYDYDLTTGKEKQLTSDGSDTILNGTLTWVYWEEIFGRQDIAYWWSGDSKSIAYFRTDESEVDEIAFVDHRTTVPTVIKQRYPKAGDKNPKVNVRIADIETGKTIATDLDNENYEYIIRVKWLNSGNAVSIETMNREQDKLELWIADKASGEITHVLTETDKAWVNVSDDLYFVDNDSKFIWASERSGYAHLYLYSIDGNLINQITHGDWAIKASSGLAWVNGAVVSVDDENNIIYFTGQKTSSLEKQLFKVNFDGSGFEQLSKTEGNHQITFSSDSKYYLDRYSSAKIPSALAIFDYKGDLVKQLSEPRTDLIKEYGIQTPDLFKIKTRYGFEMPAEIYKPKDFDPEKKYPVIFFVYGGPSAPQVQDRWSWWTYYNNLLLNQGYLVALVDNRSATGISKKTENSILKYSGGESQVDDLVDAVRWFKNQSYIDGHRIGVWGWSGGGSFTINLMTHTELFKAGIAVAAVTDWKYYDTKFAEFAMKTPSENPDGYEETSYLKSAKDLHGRLLLVHGTYDDNVHIQNAWAFTDELIKANKLFEMMVYPMRKHGISDMPATIHLFNTMIDFWKRSL